MSRRARLPMLFLLPLLSLLGAPVSAATYYVSPLGSDSNPGSAAAPWRTLQRAAGVMVAGDTTLVADGEYPGGIVQTRAGTAAGPIVSPAVNAGRAVVRGDQTTATDAFFVSGGHSVVIDGLQIRQANRAGIRISLANGVTVRGCQLLSNAKWGIFTDFADDLRLEGNECAGSAIEHGIYVSNSGDRPVVRFNRVHDNNASGIQINADPDFLRPDLGTRGDGFTDNAVVEANVVWNNGAAGGAAINLACVRNSRVVNNLLYHNRAGGISAWDNGAGTQWGSTNNTFLQNTIYFRPGEGRWCVSVKNGSLGTVVRNNVLVGGARGALEYDNDSSFLSNFNLVRSGSIAGVATNEDIGAWWSLPEWQATSGNDPQSLNADPLFRSPTTAPLDFHLQARSPAVDRGTSLPDVPFDLDGTARPQNGAWDLGCYELSGTAPPPPPPAAVTLSGLTLSPTRVRGGTRATGSVTLSGPAPAGGVVVTLASSQPAVAQVPASVTVPQGATAASFFITTFRVKKATSVTIRATYGGVTRSAVLSVAK